MRQILALLQLDFQKAWQTDKRISYGPQLVWFLLTGTIVWLPVILLIYLITGLLTAYVNSIGSMVFMFICGLFFFGWWWHVITYKLVARHYNHIGRKGKLLEDLVSYVKEVSQDQNQSKASNPELYKRIYSLEIYLSEFYQQLTVRHPGTWTIIGLVTGGLSTFYVAYFLMDEMQKLQQIEDEFIQMLNETLMELGILKYPLNNERIIPKREYAIYAAVSLVTFGLFWFYWWYVLVLDGNRYYDNSERWESSLKFMIFMHN